MVTWRNLIPKPTQCVGLQGLAHFEPPCVVGVDDLAYLIDIVPPEMRATFQTPAALRRFAPGDLASEQAAVAAAQAAIIDAGIEADAIDHVIATSFVAHWQQWFPAFGSFVHERLGLADHVPLTNIQSQCASFTDGLVLAWQLVRSGAAKKILVVAATQGLNEGDPSDPVATWAGDGAAAAIVSDERLKAIFLGSDYFATGAIHRDYRMKLRGRAFPDAVPKDAVGDEFGFWAVRDLDALLKWMGADFAHLLQCGIARALADSKLGPDEIDMAFYHQMGPREQVVLVRAGEQMGIKNEAFRDSFDMFGCAGNVDGPITMSLLKQNGEIGPGMVTMLHASGVGGANPAIMMRWV